MKRPAPDSSDPQDSDGDETWHCNRCDTTKPLGGFAKWAIRQSQHLCIECATARSHEAYLLRKTSLPRILMARFRRHMHANGASRSVTQKLCLADMEKVVSLQGGRSVFSGIVDFGRLTVGRWDDSLPWCFSNIVILTYAEVREHNKRRLVDYHTSYVSHIETHLLLSEHLDGANARFADNADSTGEDAEVTCEMEPARLSTVEQEAQCPPKNLHTRGLTTEVVMWYISKFGVMHPTLQSSSHATRPDLVLRMDAPIGHARLAAVC
jgi:hypothetical protein